MLSPVVDALSTAQSASCLISSRRCIVYCPGTLISCRRCIVYGLGTLISRCRCAVYNSGTLISSCRCAVCCLISSCRCAVYCPGSIICSCRCAVYCSVTLQPSYRCRCYFKIYRSTTAIIQFLYYQSADVMDLSYRKNDQNAMVAMRLQLFRRY